MNILFLLASLGVINGFIVGVYLLVRKERCVSDIYFAGLILALCMRIGKSVLFYFLYDIDRIILQLGLSACIFIGPFFYLYIKAVHQQQKQFRKGDLVILLLLLILISTVGVFFPYRIYPEYWNPYIVQGIYFISVSFVVLGMIQAYKLLGSKLFLFWRLKGEQYYLITICAGIIFITLSYLSALHIEFTYLWGAFIFSALFYLLAFRALSKGKSITPKLSGKKLDNGNQLLEEIDQLMDVRKLHLKQDLKLDDIAKQAGLSRHLISQVLNETHGGGYTQYIKELRVNEAKRLIASRPELSLEGIGYEAGFRSKSSFFDAFKKTTNLTPSAFKKATEDRKES